MDISKIPAGRNPPEDINVLVEIPQGDPIKYELDPESGALFVDRFLPTAMHYPGNYGFIPQTLGEDGDPLDVLVLAPGAVIPGAVMRCRPVGALLMEDEHGGDDKIIALPLDAAHPFDDGIKTVSQLPQSLRDQVAHFFQHYKDLEPEKRVTTRGWAERDQAAGLIEAAIERAKSS
jgi:inorganic pyrophosphatase